MLVDLVQTTTRDGLRLDGAFQAGDGPAALAVDAVCLVAASPPRLSHSWFRASPEGAEFQQAFALAQARVADGEAAALTEVRLPLPFVTTAAGYVEKYGPDERYNYLRFVANAPCPTLVTLGSVEVENNMAFRGAPEALKQLGTRSRHLVAETVAGADHFYTGVRPELTARVEAWL